MFTVPELPIVPAKYHQNGGFSMAMLVYRDVDLRRYFRNKRFRLVTKTNTLELSPTRDSSRPPGITGAGVDPT